MTKHGKPDANGNYVEITLHNGTFEIDSTALNRKTANLAPSSLNKKTCSFAFTGSGPVTLFNGTGLYKGISGTLTVTINFIGYGPLFTSGATKGQCNTSANAQPLAQHGWIVGKGSVKFA